MMVTTDVRESNRFFAVARLDVASFVPERGQYIEDSQTDRGHGGLVVRLVCRIHRRIEQGTLVNVEAFALPTEVPMGQVVDLFLEELVFALELRNALF